ncbi:transcriptional activator NhaR [Dechloromonas sp. A34]|uniref:transcriptional activator NhaR n=1 Tax=Dechloromonas sp. A34 TaxID=447588 RepID=UPI002249A23E|nr:transcriptional activator NhaR [Dechloromonas sp. A34]
MNHKHLFYFWKVAKAGSVARAAEAINVTPQTLSGQIGLLEASLGTELFARQGRSIVLTEAGKMALEYADELFALSAELEVMIKHHPKGRPAEFRVGVSDAVPKSLACRLLQPAIHGEHSTRIVCREWQLDRLLAQLAIHQLDMVISDGPIPPSFSVRAYNHRLLESDLTFLAAKRLLADNPAPFPACLNVLPVLLPGEDSALRAALQPWLERKRIRARVVGEFDDTALMAAFGQAGVGVFPVPSIAVEEFLAAGELAVVGRIDEVQVSYFAISVERRLTHPCVLAVTQSAQRMGLSAAG